MQCPKCGAENSDNVQVCSSCGCTLKPPHIIQSKTQTKTSKLAILSLVLGVLSLPFFLLGGLLTMIVAIVSIVRISGSRGTLKGVPLALSGIIVSVLMMCVFVLLWLVDAPPIPDDYTLADLRSAPAECAESFEILKTLIDEEWNLPGAPAVGLTKEDVKMLDDLSEVIKDKAPSDIAESFRNHAVQIEQAWARAENARDAIRLLNEFPEIADLTEPRVGAKTMRWHNLIGLTRLYQTYVNSHAEPNDIQGVLSDLIELDSVFRKLALNIRGFIEKLICLKCIEEDMVTANAIINHPLVARESVELLARHFVPLTKEQMSMRNGVLSEYFLLRSIVSEVSNEPAVVATRLFKKNSMLRLYRNFYNDWINTIEDQTNVSEERLMVWPDIYPLSEPSMSFSDRHPMPLLYRCYNPLAVRVGIFYRKDLERAPTTRIWDDLFQIVLKRRLGKEFSLKARAYSDEYIIDVKGKKIFSPGPDGEPGTKDDIKLSINPELLGW